MTEAHEPDDFEAKLKTLEDTASIEVFKAEIEAFRNHPLITRHLVGDDLDLSQMSLEDIAKFIVNNKTNEYYFLLAATTLNRTTIQTARKQAGDEGISPKYRLAHVLKNAVAATKFSSVVARAVSDRSRTLGRAKTGNFEEVFRDLLASEGIDIAMSKDGKYVVVPGLLIKRRKPDGIYPDTSKKEAPKIYVEVKSVKRVKDDIQKRLYEIAQVSIEMKWLYGSLELHGINALPDEVSLNTEKYREILQKAIKSTYPIVVGVFLCSENEAEFYRSGIEAFVDKVFFVPREIRECVTFLKEKISEIEK